MSMQEVSSLTRSTIRLMAIACLIPIGGLYYNQPLLVVISQTFQVSALQVSAVPTLTQVGFALGLLLFLPLGDRLNRRALIVTLNGLNAIVLLLIALSPSFEWLVLMSFINGMTAVTPQLIVPLAAQLASPASRGKVVGTVMGGLLAGIVVGRLVSGFAGEWLGWRSIYGLAAAVMIGLMLVLSKRLPVLMPSVTMSYQALLRSLPSLLSTHVLLRETAITGGLFFSIYCGFWATLPFLLAQPPFELGSRAAGMFGLVGVVGVLAAPVVGRIADRKGAQVTVVAAIVLLGIAMLILWPFQRAIVGILLGAVLLDLAVQTGQISNQTRIYTLPKEAHSRITTVYMVSYFLGGSLGSWLCAIGWKLANWPGVCIIGGVVTASSALVYHIYNRNSIILD